MIQLTPKQIEELRKSGKLRDSMEIWIDKHNHKLELLRTVAGCLGVLLTFCVFLKVFGVI